MKFLGIEVSPESIVRIYAGPSGHSALIVVTGYENVPVKPGSDLYHRMAQGPIVEFDALPTWLAALIPAGEFTVTVTGAEIIGAYESYYADDAAEWEDTVGTVKDLLGGM